MLLHFEVEHLELWKEGYGFMKAHTLGDPGAVIRGGTEEIFYSVYLYDIYMQKYLLKVQSVWGMTSR